MKSTEECWQVLIDGHILHVEDGCHVRLEKGKLYYCDYNGNISDPAKFSFEDPHRWYKVTRWEYVPWTFETFPKDRIVWYKQKDEMNLFAAIGISVYGIGDRTWELLFENYVQHNGKPCGKLVEVNNE